MEEFSGVLFNQRAVIEFLTARKVPPIEIHRWMQAVYGDQWFIQIQLDVQYSFLLESLKLTVLKWHFPNTITDNME
jgi:hypothetical protein